MEGRVAWETFDGEGANILATSLDRQGVARAVYPDCEDIEESLEAAGAAVRFDVDAEDPDALRRVAKEWWAAGDNSDGDDDDDDDDDGNDHHRRRRRQRGVGEMGRGSGGGGGGGAGPGGFFRGFDRVVWNFPDRGVGVVGPLAVRANQDMLAAFFKTAKPLLAKDGEIHVAMRDDEAIAAWNVAGVAARGGLVYRAALEFVPEEFPGYQHFRTLPHESLLLPRRGRGGGGRGGGRGRGRGGEGESSDDEDDEDDVADDVEECVEAAEDDVAEGAKTFIFQVDKDVCNIKNSKKSGGVGGGRG